MIGQCGLAEDGEVIIADDSDRVVRDKKHDDAIEQWRYWTKLWVSRGGEEYEPVHVGQSPFDVEEHDGKEDEDLLRYHVTSQRREVTGTEESGKGAEGKDQDNKDGTRLTWWLRPGWQMIDREGVMQL